MMQAMDRINERFGRGSIALGLTVRDAEWRMRQERLSPRYTTRWRDLAAARIGPVTPLAETSNPGIRHFDGSHTGCETAAAPDN